MLTLLGIIIGVSAVIALMSVGKGAQESITSRIESLGTNLLFVRSVNGGEITLDDALALADPVFAPSVLKVAPEVQSNTVAVFGEQEHNVPIFGVTSDFAEIRNFTIASGEFISPAHVLGKNNVVVLGSQAKEDLFGVREPIGSEILISRIPFRVVGVLASKGASALGNEDNRLLIPISTAHHKVIRNLNLKGDIPVTTINVKATEGLIGIAAEEVTTILRLRHRVIDEDDFTVASQQAVIDTLAETTATLTIFLGAVAGISLIVGGIGIMNIMLVSVTERTKEIGIRKAMGATRRDILSQFVIEAVLISLVGGLLGVAFGVLASQLLNGLPLAGTQVSTVLSGDIAVLALVVSAAIGLFFGIYPASRAAKLHPIEALRYE
ncbi:MAG: ABC transporter permease [Chloroflexi bacterium]|nr:ABC transporter permease [Chloroflexota bacterium]HCH35776.1 ABC transporter permease [Dehalococcoidia bacterium]|tara:strand:- start:862 stop:2004 length:1143 start_codon:yes stop_codon:yes gene_type:complete